MGGEGGYVGLVVEEGAMRRRMTGVPDTEGEGHNVAAAGCEANTVTDC